MLLEGVIENYFMLMFGKKYITGTETRQNNERGILINVNIMDSKIIKIAGTL